MSRGTSCSAAGLVRETGFGITRLLNFDLLPRIKRINKVKLYRPVAGEPDAYPQRTPAASSAPD